MNKLRLKGREVVDGETVLVCEVSFLGFWRREVRFVAAQKVCEGYWEWLRLPDRTIVMGLASFQLDAWYRDE